MKYTKIYYHESIVKLLKCLAVCNTLGFTAVYHVCSMANDVSNINFVNICSVWHNKLLTLSLTSLSFITTKWDCEADATLTNAGIKVYHKPGKPNSLYYSLVCLNWMQCMWGLLCYCRYFEGEKTAASPLWDNLVQSHMNPQPETSTHCKSALQSAKKRSDDVTYLRSSVLSMCQEYSSSTTLCGWRFLYI